MKISTAALLHAIYLPTNRHSQAKYLIILVKKRWLAELICPSICSKKWTNLVIDNSKKDYSIFYFPGVFKNKFVVTFVIELLFISSNLEAVVFILEVPGTNLTKQGLKLRKYRRKFCWILCLLKCEHKSLVWFSFLRMARTGEFEKT